MNKKMKGGRGNGQYPAPSVFLASESNGPSVFLEKNLFVFDRPQAFPAMAPLCYFRAAPIPALLLPRRSGHFPCFASTLAGPAKLQGGPRPAGAPEQQIWSTLPLPSYFQEVNMCFSPASQYYRCTNLEQIPNDRQQHTQTSTYLAKLLFNYYCMFVCLS